MKATISNRLTCVDCKHYDAENQPAGQGLCRESSPQVIAVALPATNPKTGETQFVPQVTYHFPGVGHACWCGKLERKLLIAH